MYNPIIISKTKYKDLLSFKLRGFPKKDVRFLCLILLFMLRKSWAPSTGLWQSMRHASSLPRCENKEDQYREIQTKVLASSGEKPRVFSPSNLYLCGSIGVGSSGGEDP